MKTKRVAQKARPRAKASRVSAKMVETPASYLEVSISEPVTEESLIGLFEQVRVEVLRQQPRRVLVDMRQASVALTISDLNGLAKLVAGNFAGVLEKLAFVLRPQDVPAEKFFEPSVSSRGLPTYVTPKLNEGIDWLTAKPGPVR